MRERFWNSAVSASQMLRAVPFDRTFMKSKSRIVLAMSCLMMASPFLHVASSASYATCAGSGVAAGVVVAPAAAVVVPVAGAVCAADAGAAGNGGVFGSLTVPSRWPASPFASAAQVSHSLYSTQLVPLTSSLGTRTTSSFNLMDAISGGGRVAEKG
ncbi:hypothetical protein BD309DRAFT_692310 [Dichomitus squalens]|nr:hypothetical protein BD309DRAFT_692310 [Dichomitus squalens]